MRRRVLFLISLTGFLSNIHSQECNNKILASKVFPSSAPGLIWKSFKPAEYLYPGEIAHIKVTGQVNLKPEKKSEDKGGFLGFFSSRVEWVEDHWIKPAQKKPKFQNVDLVAGSEKSDLDGSYECDIKVPITPDLTKPTILEVQVLKDDELTGSGGLSSGEFVFEIEIDNAPRKQLVEKEILTKLSGWGTQAVERLKSLIDADDRLKCRYSESLASTIFQLAIPLEKKRKQVILEYATSLNPQNHDIIVELASSYSGTPGGCEKQIKALKDAGITQITVNSDDFKTLNNSARAFDILGEAYFDCSDDFRDDQSLDSLRSYYRLAATQYGMTYNYPKQMEVAVKYANLELDNNDKNELLNSARFLEEIWETVPQNIDSVSEEERMAFFGKFGNTRHNYYRQVKDSIAFTLTQTNNIAKDVLHDEITVTIKKGQDQSFEIYYQYIDRYQLLLTSPVGTKINNNVLSFHAMIDKDFNIKLLNYITKIEKKPVSDVLTIQDEGIFPKENDLTKQFPNALSAFIRYLDMPEFCPKATIEGNHVSQKIYHKKGDFDLLYFTNESVYSVLFPSSLFFLGLENPFCLLSANRGTAKNTKDQLVLNKNVEITLVDNTGIIWQLSNINFN